MSEQKTKLPLRDRLAARLHELQCDRMKCDEQCKDDYEYEAADEIIAMVSTEQPLCAVCKDKQASICSLCHSEELNRTSQAEGLITKHGAVFPGD